MGMLREGSNCFPGVWIGGGAAGMAKPCGCCHLAAALVFCRTDNTFVCLACDTHQHARHERVWVCEVCEQAAASVTCRADAAALCVACDRDIHSANPLAQRHERVPVVPFYHPIESVVKSTAATLLVDLTTTRDIAPCLGHHEESYNNNTKQWIPPNTITTSKLPLVTEMKPSMDFIFSDSENNFLDFDYSSVVSIDTQSQVPHYNPSNDSVVPVQTTTTTTTTSAIKPLPFHHQEKHFEIDFTQSHIKSYNTPSISVSSSSLDVGIVPDGSSISEISYPYMKNVNNNVDLPNLPGEKLLSLDREARVLRYREKKKNRKFEKTIRYASRKAYAETRPRIKGRFAKRNDGDGARGINCDDIDQIFSDGDFIGHDSRYGIVPSFLVN
ncbi:zinc finger protein CONSTANS-LIKE 5 [Capsicum galapagoense]